jgi:hypothetical protein
VREVPELVEVGECWWLEHDSLGEGGSVRCGIMDVVSALVETRRASSAIGSGTLLQSQVCNNQASKGIHIRARVQHSEVGRQVKRMNALNDCRVNIYIL